MAKTSSQYAAQLYALNRARLQSMMRANANLESYHQHTFDQAATGVNPITTPGPMQLAMEGMTNAGAQTNLPSISSKPVDNGDNGDTHPEWFPEEDRLKDMFYMSPIGAPIWLAEKAIQTGPGKAVMDVLSRGDYASANAALVHGQIALDRSDPEYAKEHANIGNEIASSLYNSVNPKVLNAFWEGLKGDKKTTYSDVVKQQNPGSSSLTQGAGGFALDLLADPTTYIPGADVAKWSKQGIEAAKGLRAGVKATEGVEDTAKVADDIAANQSIITQPQDTPAPTLTDVATEVPKANAASLITKLAQDAPQVTEQNPQLNDVLKGTIQDAVANTPVKVHPNIENLPGPFKTVEHEEEISTPKTVYEDQPVEAKPVDDPNAEKLARLRAIKLAILQNPDYKVGPAQHRVADLIESAKANPDIAPQVEKTINSEAKRVFREGSKDLGLIKFSGRTGSTAAGLTVDQATELLHKGEIPKADITGDFNKNYPLHDVTDLDNLYLTNVKGEKTSLRNYLEGLGVKVTQVTQDKPFRFDFETEKPAAVTKKVPKTIYEKTTKKVQKTESLSGDELQHWVSQVSENIGPKEAKFLRGAIDTANPTKEYERRLSILAAKRVAGNFKTLDELDKAYNKGLISDDAIKQLLKISGAKNWKEFKTKVNTALAQTGEDTGKTASKVTRLTGIDENDPFMSAVPKPDKIAEDLARNPAATTKPVPVITPERLEDLSKVLPAAIIKNLVDPQDIKKYPFLSGIDLAKRTNKQLGVGLARNLKGWHKFSQMDVFKGLVQQASKRHPVPSKGTISNAARRQAFNERSTAMMNEVMTGMRLAEAALKQSGVKFIAGVDNSGVLLSAVDILDSMDPRVVRNYLFRPPGANVPTVTLTGLMDAVEDVAKSKMGQLDPTLAQTSALSKLVSEPGISKLKAPQAEAVNLLKRINEAMPAIMTRINANYAEESVKLGEAVTSMSDEVIHDVISKYTDPNTSMTDAFQTFADRYKAIAAKGRSIKAPPGATKVAGDRTDLTLANKIAPGDFAEASMANDMSKTVTSKQAAKVGTKQYLSRKQEALADLGDTTDMGDKYEASLHAALFRAEVPLLDKVGMVKDVLGRTFISQWRHQDLHYLLHRERNVVQSLARSHRALMQNTWEIARTVAGDKSQEAIQEAFRHMQDGTAPTDEGIQQIMDSMQNSIGLMFSSNGGKLNYATRNGFFASHLNDVMAFYGIPEEYMFKEGVPIAEQGDAWRTWSDVQDPLDLLDKVHAAMQRATVETTLGRAFSQEFGSAVQKPGYVKITDNGSTSKLHKFIDSDLYFPREIAEQFKYLDSTIRGTFVGNPSGTPGALLRKYDSILHAWKSGVTIYRPGHHIRNLIGDLSLSFYAGVNNPLVYRKALRVMASRAKAYEGWDGLKALEEQTSNLATGVKKTLVKVGGKRQAIDDDLVWRLAFDQGILPDYRVLEDISFNPSQGISKLGGVSLTRPLAGKGQKFFGGLSQSRDHYVRLAHFIHDLEKGNFKSIQEAADYAGKQVRKWHPDGSDLTPFESKVMRRLIPFYSWVRKAVPLVVETMVMKPGKAILFPKAMYNTAVAMGIDPDSISNPFPQDQLFPNFLSEQLIGPQWRGDLFGIPGFGDSKNRYYGLNPGEPITDVGGTYLGAEPDKQVLGGLTPLIRIPLELETGKNLGTGSDITSTSEYLDQQIPGLGYLASATGTDPLGGFSPNQNVQKGYQQPGTNAMTIANFLTGLGIKDYSKPQYIRRAQFELLDKLKAEHGNH